MAPDAHHYELTPPLGGGDHVLGAPHAALAVVEYLDEVHPHALDAAEASECAAAQGKFWPMHDLLFEHQRALKPRHLDGYAELLELDMVRFRAEMKDTVYLQRVREHQESGHASGVRATPTFFIDGRIVDTSFGLNALFDEVEKALAA
jgi:protein-disulfide isomerase